MKRISYSHDAAKDLRRYGKMVARIQKAINDYAADAQAHANNVTQLVGSSRKRLRVGDFRILFDETNDTIEIVKIAARGEAYD